MNILVISVFWFSTLVTVRFILLSFQSAINNSATLLQTNNLLYMLAAAIYWFYWFKLRITYNGKIIKRENTLL